MGDANQAGVACRHMQHNKLREHVTQNAPVVKEQSEDCDHIEGDEIPDSVDQLDDLTFQDHCPIADAVTSDRRGKLEDETPVHT